MTMTEKGRGFAIFRFIQKSGRAEEAQDRIAESLPAVIAGVMQREDLEVIRKRLVALKEDPKIGRMSFRDFKMALGIFMLVFLSTFPVVIPFLFIQDLAVSLRTSNAVAIIMMFSCGWILARYAGRNKWIMGFLMSAIGTALVLLTISLGG